MIKYYIVVFLFIISFSACTSKPHVIKPSSINEMIDNKEDIEYNNINITTLDNAVTVILEDEKIKFISPTKDYTGYPIAEDEYLIYIGKNGYDTKLDKEHEFVCGRGNKLGYIGLLHPIYILETFQSNNEAFCTHKFTSTSDYLLGERFGSGMLTFGTSLITAVDLHKERFDRELFKEVIIESKLYLARDKIIEKLSSLNIQNGLDVIYVDINNLEESFQDAYEDLVFENYKRDGIVLMDEESKRVISLVIFNKDVSVTKSIIEALSQISSDVVTLNLKEIKESDIKSYIPKMIQTPNLPPVKKLIKDEFETKKEFLTRVEIEVQKREEKIRNIQREYELQVQRRNNYIYSLENSFLQYNKYIDEKKTKFFNKFIVESDNLAKLLFLERLSGYNAVDFRYDAELQRLYFNVFANNADIKNKSFIEIEPIYAKKIKYERAFDVIPIIESSHNTLKLKEIYLLSDGNKYPVKFTDINYKPEQIFTTVKKPQEKITTVKNNTFESYVQQPLSLADNKNREIWYIDVAQRFNAKVPEWFQKTVVSKDGVVGYGTADTLSSAKAEARSEIAFMISSNVKSDISNKEYSDNFNSNFTFQTDTAISTEVKLNNRQTEVIKQELVDGKWYVALNYKIRGL